MERRLALLRIQAGEAIGRTGVETPGEFTGFQLLQADLNGWTLDDQMGRGGFTSQKLGEIAPELKRDRFANYAGDDKSI